MLGFGGFLREGSVCASSRWPGQSVSAGGKEGPCGWVVVTVATGDERRAGGLEPGFPQWLRGDRTVSPRALVRRRELERPSRCRRCPQPVLRRRVLFRFRSA